MFEIEKQVEKRPYCWLYVLFSSKCILTLFFNDNVLILCLSCKVEKSKTTSIILLKIAKTNTATIVLNCFIFPVRFLLLSLTFPIICST